MKGKIINDPVYGFIRFPEKELLALIDHPWFQRLRQIKQMGLAHLVYPGATHTRFHHSLGACHLMGKALQELQAKGVKIDPEEQLAARIAILLHDIGHGPFSHALENSLVPNLGHEELSIWIMVDLLRAYGSMGQLALDIFENKHPKPFLHQLVSSQLDVDRMDYLNRDSFYTGVSEGVIGYDRILQMLTVENGNLLVEEKGVHSVEKFIIARRLMYWQVYLHKTVLSAELMIIKILQRARYLAQQQHKLFAPPALAYFLYQDPNTNPVLEDPHFRDRFCQLDDADLLCAMKVWQEDKDLVLSTLCRMLRERKLFKLRLSTEPQEELRQALHDEWKQSTRLSDEEIEYFIFTGTASNATYNLHDERIQIAMKSGEVLDISAIDNPIINQTLAGPVQKNYICFTQKEYLSRH